MRTLDKKREVATRGATPHQMQMTAVTRLSGPVRHERLTPLSPHLHNNNQHTKNQWQSLLAVLAPLETAGGFANERSTVMMERTLHTTATGFLLVALLALVATALAPAQSWEFQGGPWRATNVRSIAGAYTNNVLHLYAANQGSTLVKSNDGGASWTHITQIASPRVVACKATNPDTVVAATATGQVRLTTDGGATWTTKINENDLVALRLLAAPAGLQPNRIWLGTTFVSGKSSLRKSADGGASWVDDNYFKNTVSTHVTSILFNQQRKDTVWVAGSGLSFSGSQAPQSGEGGGEPMFESYQFVESEANPEEAQAVTRGIWWTQNGGATWNSRGMGTKNITAMAVSYDPDRDDQRDTMLVLAGTSEPSTSGTNAELYTSRNLGGNWSRKKIFNGVKEIRSIQVHPDDPDVFIVATEKGVYVSYDLGGTWQASTLWLYDRDVQALLVDPRDSYVLFAGTPSSIFRQDDQADPDYEWYSINTGIDPVNTTMLHALEGALLAGSVDVNAVSVNEDFTLRAAQQTNRPLRVRLEQNQEWINYEVWRNGKFTPLAVARQSSSSYYSFLAGTLGTGKGAIFRSSDPEEWNNVYSFSDTNSNLTCIAIDPVNESIVFAGGNGGSTGNLLRSTNSGTSWTTSTVNASSQTIHTLAIDSTGAGSSSPRLYAGLESGGIWRSTDAGQSWAQLGLSGQRIFTIALDLSTPTVLCAGGSNGLWRSTNSGSTWQQVRTDTVKKIVMHPYTPGSPDNLFVLVRANGASAHRIHEGKNGCTSWREVTGNLPATISTLTSDPGTPGVLYCGTSSGVHSLALGTPDPPTLVSPPSGSTLHTNALDFVWNASFGTLSYQFQVGSDASFNSVLTDVIGYADTTVNSHSNLTHISHQF